MHGGVEERTAKHPLSSNFQSRLLKGINVGPKTIQLLGVGVSSQKPNTIASKGVIGEYLSCYWFTFYTA